MPTSPADLMLRMVNYMVDSYLELRRLLTRQIDYLQKQLVDPRADSGTLRTLLDSRNSLRLLEDTCEDQRAAIAEWIDALEEWPVETDPRLQREREQLRLRSRDVLEHIERVLAHVRRLESSADTAVQMHFSEQNNRTNDIMRALTVLTAIFLPLNFVDRLLRHELRGPAADPQRDRLLDRVRRHARDRHRHERLLLAQALPEAKLSLDFRFSARDLALLTLLTVVWGLNWPVMKLGVTGFPPLELSRDLDVARPAGALRRCCAGSGCRSRSAAPTGPSSPSSRSPT